MERLVYIVISDGDILYAALDFDILVRLAIARCLGTMKNNIRTSVAQSDVLIIVQAVIFRTPEVVVAAIAPEGVVGAIVSEVVVGAIAPEDVVGATVPEAVEAAIVPEDVV